MTPERTPHAFVGRSLQLREVRAAQQQSALGELRVALVLGDAGLGKTRLSTELLPREDDAAVGLVAHSSPLRRMPSWGCWANVLSRDAQDVQDEPSCSRCCDGAEQVADQLARLCAERPVVLVLDDIHCAGDALWQMLLALAWDHPESRLLVLATARPAALVAHRIAAEVLRALEQAVMLRRVHLPPLARDDIEKLAAATLHDRASPALVDFLMTRSQGSPLLAVSLLEALVDERADLRAPRWCGIPERLIGWVRAEVARLDPLSTALVELLALIDGEVDPDDLSRIADQPLEDIAVALERLVRCGLVVEQDHGHSLGYALAYPLIREALRVGISGARRRVLHRQVARRLLVGDGSTGATPPIEGSARKDFDRIDALITAIGQAEQQGSHAQVWSCLQTLLDLLSPGDPRVRDAFDALSWQEDWEVAYWAQPCVVAGVPALRRMEQLLAASADAYRTASVRFRLARILTLGAGDLDSGRHECRQALALFQQAGCEQEARIAAIELARLRGWAGDLSGQEHGARQALGEAEKMSDQRAIARALWVLGLALDLQGRFGEAEDVLLRGVELARAGGRSSWRSRQLAEIAVLDAYRGHMASARARWQEAVSTHACPEELVWASGAQIALLAGDLATVAAHAHEATVHCPDARSPLRSWMAAMAAMAAAEGDRIAEARRDLERAELLHQGRDLYLFSRFCRWAEGAVALAEGRLANAAAALRGTVRSFSDMGAWTLAAFVLADLAETSVAADDPGAAMWAAGCADDIAHRTGSPSSQALERFAAACASLLCDHHDEAADAAARAASGFGHSGHIMLEARAHVVFAAAAQRHDRAAAAAALHKAAVAFDGCGAVLRREQARQLLTRLSTCGQRAAASSGPASLTTRELQVAELAARGYTARQIARSLCIGTRTVETHLARIYPKLGVTSKQDLVHRGPQLGLAAAPHYSVVSTDHDCVS